MKELSQFLIERVWVIALTLCFSISGCATVDQPIVQSGCEGVEERDPAKAEFLNDPLQYPSKTADLRELGCTWFNDKETDPQIRELRMSQRFAVESFVYSIAAFNVYEYPESNKEPIPFPRSENWGSEAILIRENEKTGFYGKSWIREKEDGTRELVVSYRGTGEEKEDWCRANLVFFGLFFDDNQFEDAIAFAHESRQAAKNSGGHDRLVFVGHSLGGGLAQYAQRHFKNSRAVVFDPSPNRGRIYSLFESLEPVDSLRIYERGEVLGYLRKLVDFDRKYDENPVGPGKKTRWMDFYGGGAVGQHDMQDLAMNLIKVAASVGNPDALDIIKNLESFRTKEQLSASYYDLRSPNNIHRKRIRAEHQERSETH